MCLIVIFLNLLLIFNPILNQKKTVISFYGASVTAQKDGYVYELQKIMENWEIEKYGFPGSGINLCKLDLVLKNKPSIVFLQWSLHGYSGKISVIKNLVWRIVNSSAIPVFIHMPRSDLNSSGAMSAATTIRDINKVALELNVTVYDLRNQIPLEELNNGLLRDSVHTLPEGSKRYALELKKLLMRDKPKFPLPFLCSSEEQCFPKLIKVNLKSYKTFTFKLQGEIIGMYVIVGPNSNYIDYYKNGKFHVRKLLWDGFCYYPRIKYGYPYQSETLSLIDIKVQSINFSRAECRRNISIDYESLVPTLEVDEICYVGQLFDISVDS